MDEHFYTKEDFENISKAKTFKDLANVALDIIERIPKPITQVCGPISTGGLGNVISNLERFEKSIKYLKSKNLNIFYQLAFEDKMFEIDTEWKKENPGKDYCFPLLTDFFLPIFESKKIESFYFIPGWETSTGSVWEREQAKRLNIKIFDIPEDFENTL